MTQQLPDVEPDLDASATNNPIAMEAPALFDLGAVVATPPALRLIGQYGASITQLLNWHQTGQRWNEMDPDDCAANWRAVSDKDARLLSSFNLGTAEVPAVVWIITEWNREVTTVLLPSCY
jgi:hypothetical protein